ncbi:radical SAM protein [Enhygromyxa salina]|uniref:Antilisterial bacteriocin subtilosin biosynthesis protein AlbA n=1 Tax=Enhygromyxa salina TaxID=215803 RepID=A0A2S9YDN7_9BACT|nr:radical SAM protein [Enhygromyxa salina]PRQ03224.1 Antilisterial bacteriocin subtilosin biosynthesis protein AlbA [Enhygromyxa salina]
MEPNERFEIQLSHVCNNRCVFCVSGQMTELRMAKPTPLDDVKAKFDEARKRGITKATIMGGEPTIHPTFFPTVEYAIELGFSTIVIFTNGVRLDKQAFVDRIMEIGKDKLQWRISIQGWDRETHDFTTKKPGAFDRIIAGLETLTELGQYISCNMCVVEQNYRSLVKLPDMVSKYPIQQVHLDMVRPRDSGVRTEDYLDGIMPDYADLGRVMRQMFEGLDQKAPGFNINVGNLPFCQLPDWAHRIHHGGNKTYTVSAEGPGKLSVVAWDKYEDKRSDKLKLDSCGSCVFERRCDGFFGLYAKRRGTEQFLPVSREKLRRSDPEQRTFIHQIDAALVAMVRERFAGWHLHGANDSEFDRWARQTWVHEDGGRAQLTFLPRDAPGGGDAEHRDFVARVDSWSGVSEAQVIELLGGVVERMAVVLGGEAANHGVRVAPSAQRFAQRRGLPTPELATGIAPAIMAGLRRIAGHRNEHGSIVGWQLDSCQPQGRGATVHFIGPNRASSTLHLLISDAGKVSGKWAFGRGDEQAKRKLALAITALLRPAPRAPAAGVGAAAP